ncbi:hypothetical protein FRC00_003233, partial [Tulasnella sp. 408]
MALPDSRNFVPRPGLLGSSPRTSSRVRWDEASPEYGSSTHWNHGRQAPFETSLPTRPYVVAWENAEELIDSSLRDFKAQVRQDVARMIRDIFENQASRGNSPTAAHHDPDPALDRTATPTPSNLPTRADVPPRGDRQDVSQDTRSQGRSNRAVDAFLAVSRGNSRQLEDDLERGVIGSQLEAETELPSWLDI